MRCLLSGEQFCTDSFPGKGKPVFMIADIRVVEVKIDPPGGIIVTFSDGTVGAYVVEELLNLRPYREPEDDSSVG
jgi:hypothetical protein